MLRYLVHGILLSFFCIGNAHNRSPARVLNLTWTLRGQLDVWCQPIIVEVRSVPERQLGAENEGWS